jgi:nitrite reductase/ring-hydroxylating ferredoxin subunit
VTRHALFAESELAPGEFTRVEVDGIGIVVLRTQAGELCALRDICSHQGARLSNGTLEAAVVGHYRLLADRAVMRCPWHGYEFDVSTGLCVADPTERVRAYPVSVEDGVVSLER